MKEGEVRMLMVRDTLFEIIHKKPAEGGMSAVGGTGAALAFYPPDAPEYADLRATFLGEDAPRLLEVLGLRGQPLPLIWTADFIPADGEAPGSTRWIVGEFNCSCVGVSHFLDARGARVDVSDVSDEEYERGMRLCDLIGRTAVCMLDEMRRERESEALGEVGVRWSEVGVRGGRSVAATGARWEARFAPRRSENIYEVYEVYIVVPEYETPSEGDRICRRGGPTAEGFVTVVIDRPSSRRRTPPSSNPEVSLLSRDAVRGLAVRVRSG